VGKQVKIYTGKADGRGKSRQAEIKNKSEGAERECKDERKL